MTGLRNMLWSPQLPLTETVSVKGSCCTTVRLAVWHTDPSIPAAGPFPTIPTDTPVHMCDKTETCLVNMQARLEAVASGRMDVLVLWFDLHLAEGVSITSGETY